MVRAPKRFPLGGNSQPLEEEPAFGHLERLDLLPGIFKHLCLRKLVSNLGGVGNADGDDLFCPVGGVFLHVAEPCAGYACEIAIGLMCSITASKYTPFPQL